ncbi:hypothetical protein AgCh_029708 [Apium graveolens]
MASGAPASTQVVNLLLFLISILLIISLFESSSSRPVDATYSVRRFLLQRGHSGVRPSPSRKGPGGRG